MICSRKQLDEKWRIAMIKILKPGTKKEITCDKCGALLSYDEKEDMKEECIEKAFVTNMPSGCGRKQEYIICPQCKNKIVTWSTRWERTP